MVTINPPADDHYKNWIKKKKTCLKTLKSIQKQKQEKSLNLKTHMHTHTQNCEEEKVGICGFLTQVYSTTVMAQIWKPSTFVAQGARDQNTGLCKQVKI